jgi:hypothetical protein
MVGLMRQNHATNNVSDWPKIKLEGEQVRNKFKKLLEDGKRSQEKVFSTMTSVGLDLPATRAWTDTPPGSVILYVASSDSKLLHNPLDMHAMLVGQSSFGEYSECDFLHSAMGRGAMAHASEFFHFQRAAMHDAVADSTYNFYVAMPLKQRHANIGRWIENIARASMGSVCFEAMPEDEDLELVGPKADMAYLEDRYQRVFASPDDLQPLRPAEEGINCVEFVIECVQLAVMHLNKIHLDGGYQVVELPILNLDSRTAQPQQLMGAMQGLCYFNAVAQCQYPSISESVLQNQKRIIKERKEQARQLADGEESLMPSGGGGAAQHPMCPAGSCVRFISGDPQKVDEGEVTGANNDTTNAVAVTPASITG